MKDFDDLKNLWSQPATTLPEIKNILKLAKDGRYKLLRSQLLQAIMLFATTFFIVLLALFADFNFKSKLTYLGMAFIALVPFLQGIISLFVFYKIKAIDVTENPAVHLQKWEAYYAFRQKLIRINLPLYFILLNAAFALYFIELMALLPTSTRVIALSVYVAWMLFAYFYLGGRSKKKERQKIEAIINNLKNIESQLS